MRSYNLNELPSKYYDRILRKNFIKNGKNTSFFLKGAKKNKTNLIQRLCTQRLGFPSGSEVNNTASVKKMQETQVWSLGWEDPLEEGMATHSSVLAWRIPRTEELGGLQSMGLQRVRHDWVTNTSTFQQWNTYIYTMKRHFLISVNYMMIHNVGEYTAIW